MDLSKKDRLMLINQYRILSILNPDGASSYNIRIRMLEQGYSIHYDEMVNWVDDGMSQEECQEIIDILEMYRCLWHSYKKLRDKRGISRRDVRFPGFDAKEEEKQLNYAEYVLYSLKRFKEFHQRRKLPNHDSYKVMLGEYRSMLSVWNSLGNRKQLNKEEIIQILNGERAVTEVDEAYFDQNRELFENRAEEDVLADDNESYESRDLEEAAGDDENTNEMADEPSEGSEAEEADGDQDTYEEDEDVENITD